MTDARRSTGRRGEALAAEALRQRGWHIVTTNWRCGVGEIDLVARDGESLVLVEVRTRHGRRFGTPEESVDALKRERLAMLGELYVQETGWAGPWRIDVVAVELDRDGAPVRVTHYPDAVGR
jgi:putative endonuclease